MGGDLYELEPVLVRQGVATTRRALVQRRLVARGVVPPGCASFGPGYNADHSCYDTRPRPIEAANVVLPPEIKVMPSPRAGRGVRRRDPPASATPPPTCRAAGGCRRAGLPGPAVPAARPGGPGRPAPGCCSPRSHPSSPSGRRSSPPAPPSAPPPRPACPPPSRRARPTTWCATSRRSSPMVEGSLGLPRPQLLLASG